MNQMVLRDDQREKIEPLISGESHNDCGVTGKGNRLFLEAVLWVYHIQELRSTTFRQVLGTGIQYLSAIIVGHKKDAQEAETVGKSRGGLSTKIHATVDALGNPVRLLVNSSHASEHGQANALIESFDTDYVLTDKGYDSDRFRGA